jgi:hypothetical protein
MKHSTWLHLPPPRPLETKRGHWQTSCSDTENKMHSTRSGSCYWGGYIGGSSGQNIWGWGKRDKNVFIYIKLYSEWYILLRNAVLWLLRHQTSSRLLLLSLDCTHFNHVVYDTNSGNVKGEYFFTRWTTDSFWISLPSNELVILLLVAVCHNWNFYLW